MNNTYNSLSSNDYNFTTSLKDSYSESENDFYSLNSKYIKIFPISGINKKESLNQNSMESEEREIFNSFIKEKKIEKKEITKKFKIINKKRGKKKEKNNKRKHNYDALDNLYRKIQVHYLSFIISYINNILKELNYNLKFCNLNYKFKTSSKKEQIKSFNDKTIGKIETFNDKTIGEIISNDISTRYRYKEMNYNKLLYEKIKNNEVLKNILSENYLKLFQKIYYINKKQINLKEYGLDKTINLSKDVKMYKDLLLKVGERGKNRGFKRNMSICMKKHFFPDWIFIVN